MQPSPWVPGPQEIRVAMRWAGGKGRALWATGGAGQAESGTAPHFSTAGLWFGGTFHVEERFNQAPLPPRPRSRSLGSGLAPLTPQERM